jgi:hypothetical protein
MCDHSRAASSSLTNGAPPRTCGVPADMIAVDVDPWSAGPEQLREMPVALTLLGGRATHGDEPLIAG